MRQVKSDIEIARAAKMMPIGKVLGKINIPDNSDSFSPMGRHIAKLNFEYIDKLREKKSNLILVTAITPTPAGEGKTTTSVGLNDGLNKIGNLADKEKSANGIIFFNSFLLSITASIPLSLIEFPRRAYIFGWASEWARLIIPRGEYMTL